MERRKYNRWHIRFDRFNENMGRIIVEKSGLTLKIIS